MLLCALVGMLLATTSTLPLQTVVLALVGIGFVASSAAVINHVFDSQIDARMSRTRDRPVAQGRISTRQALTLSAVLALVGSVILFFGVNPLTAWLNFGSWLGYAVIYSMWLKYLTPQNIVIGGLFGAAPPLFGWTAVTGTIAVEPLLLVLIIFLWTPPHFWALAIVRAEEYEKANVPMMPVLRGHKYTKQQILLYIGLLSIASIIPVTLGLSGLIYLVSVVLLGAVFVGYGIAMYRVTDTQYARETFKYSITYLALLFCALVVDHYASIYLM